MEKSRVKSNIIRLVVVVLLATACVLYLHWHKASYEDERQTVKINCVNNLKQIGLGFRIWEGDHGDKYPFDVSTNTGGTMELTPAKDGFYQDAYLFLRAMSNELTVPLLLICPNDKAKQPASDWASVSASNVTYQFPTGTNGILAICPVDGNVLYADGTGLDKNGKVPKKENQ